MALAVALGVPVLGLLLPFSEERTGGELDTDADSVAVTAANTVDWYAYVSWLMGRSLLSQDAKERGTSTHWHDSVALMDKVRAHQEALASEQEWHNRKIECELSEPGSEKARMAASLHREAIDKVLGSLSELLAAGVRPRPVQPRIAELAREYALPPDVREFLGLGESNSEAGDGDGQG